MATNKELEQELATLKEELTIAIKDRDEHKGELATTNEENATLKEEVLRLSGDIESKDKYIDTLEAKLDTVEPKAESKKPKDGEVEIVLLCTYGKNKPNDRITIGIETAEHLVKVGDAKYV